MKLLNVVDLESWIHSESSEIIYSNPESGEERLTQFLNLLHTQPIAQRILERISEDYSEIKKNIPTNGSKERIAPRTKDQIKSLLKTRFEQGAFGFFVIQNLFQIEKKYTHHYIDGVNDWYYRTGAHYSEMYDSFNEKFFKPFVQLLLWYINESSVKSNKDYFSKDEIIIINEKLDKILLTQEASSEIIFNEIEELKELLLFLNKKNWVEIFKGKLTDAGFGLILSNENLMSLFNYISENISLLK